jgi:hypothetical protein
LQYVPYEETPKTPPPLPCMNAHVDSFDPILNLARAIFKKSRKWKKNTHEVISKENTELA